MIYQKDNAEVLKKTIEPHLKKGTNTIINQKLSVGFNAEGEIECVLGDGKELKLVVMPDQHMYIIGNLAFYAMILGKDNSSGYWCYLC